MFNLFSSNREKFVSDQLAYCRLSLNRLNDDPDIDHPQVRSLLNKEYVSFEDELKSSFLSLLILAKKVCDLKSRDFEFDPWFLERLSIVSEHTFSLFNYLNNETVEMMDKLTIEFYHEAPVNKNIVDIRDKLNAEREISLL